MACKNEKEICLTCPLDGESAFVSLDADGCLNCSHSSGWSTCPSHCGARSILNREDGPTRMVIVCPEDGTMARVTVENGELLYCSHQKHMPDCNRDCVKPV